LAKSNEPLSLELLLSPAFAVLFELLVSFEDVDEEEDEACAIGLKIWVGRCTKMGVGQNEQ
jgi:hypothetical protein